MSADDDAPRQIKYISVYICSAVYARYEDFQAEKKI